VLGVDRSDKARIPLIAENSLALWLLVFGVNEAKWRAQTGRGEAK
jgi:hypothetical protein